MVERNKEDRDSTRQLLYRTYYLIHLTTLLRGSKYEVVKGFLTCIENFTISNLVYLTAREKYHIEAAPWPPQIATKRPHTTLRSITPNRIPKLFTRNKSNTTFMAVLLIIR